MQKITFWSWLKKQIKRDDPVGDLVRDLSRDPCLAKNSANFGKILYHLREEHGVGTEVIAALRQAQAEYEQVKS